MRLAVLIAIAALVGRSAAQVDPNSGIDFVTIGAVGNRAYDGPDPFNRVLGRGRVDYEYAIGRTEVTSGQWAEFFDAALNRPDPIPWVLPPTQIGTGPMPVGGVSWRTCAVYANWLHNHKASNREAFLNGAYDVATFRNLPTGFTDQLTHSPGARYWIPTLDEHMKAAHYDPARANPDGSVGGWWQYNITSDIAPIYGPPPGFTGGSPLNQANSGFRILPGRDEFRITLGAYASVTSPWGLFDTAGGTREWTENIELVLDGVPAARTTRGSAWAAGIAGDLIWSLGGDGHPDTTLYLNGLRMASSIPGAGTVAIIGVGGMLCSRGRSRPARRPHYEAKHGSLFGAWGGGVRGS